MGRPGRWIVHPEVQILQSCQKSDYAFNKCEKKQNHSQYVKPCDVPKYVPPNLLTTDIFVNFINTMYYLTAMVELPIDNDCVRCGTCFVQKVETVTNRPCPCPECQGHGQQRWGKVTLTTALHVVEAEEHAPMCKVRLFYDDDDCRDQEKIIHGIKSHSRDEKGDWCALVCVTHDLDLLKDLEDKLNEYWNLGHKLKEDYQDTQEHRVVVVAHPHGGPKRVSIGKAKVKDFTREVRDDQDWCYYSYDAATCDGSSGAPVYVLGRWNDGFGYWFGHSHNHSGIDNSDCSSSTVGVDSTYGQRMASYSYVSFETDAE